MSNVNHAVIAAGGLGSRMKIINPNLPKELLPLNRKPIIQYALEEIVRAKISHVIIIINSKKEIIRKMLSDIDYARNLYPNAVAELENIMAKITTDFFYQNEPKGEIDAISLADKVVGEKPFAIIYPDDLYFPTGKILKQLCNMYAQYESNVIALSEVTPENAKYIGNTGRVNLKKKKEKLYFIKDFLPKKTGCFQLRFQSEYRTSGYMVSRHEIFYYIKRMQRKITKEFNDILIRREMIKDYHFLGFVSDTDFFDVGNPVGFKHCIDQINDP